MYFKRFLNVFGMGLGMYFKRVCECILNGFGNMVLYFKRVWECILEGPNTTVWVGGWRARAFAANKIGSVTK